MLGAPYVLVLLLPVAALIFLMHGRRAVVMPSLPGAWMRVVDPVLQRHLARSGGELRSGQAMLAAAIAALIIVALARPLVEVGQTANYANLAGRVIVLDVRSNDGLAERRAVAREIAAALPDIPVAVVAVAGESYTVVPLTTDTRHLNRYVNVLSAEMIPAPGGALNVGLASAEALLAGAGVHVGQIILISSDAPPRQSAPIAPSDTSRSIVALGDASGWEAFADRFDAKLFTNEDAQETSRSFQRQLRQFHREKLREGSMDVGPWIIGVALLLWLGLFRRRSQ